MKINQFESALSLIDDDLIAEAISANKSKKASFLSKWVNRSVACLLIVLLVGISIKLVNVNINENSSLNSYLMTFDNVKYELISDTGSSVMKTILEKYNLPSTITEDMLGDFVGYVGGTLGSKPPKNQEDFKLYYIKGMPTLDILILQDYSNSYSYVISENLEESTFAK